MSALWLRIRCSSDLKIDDIIKLMTMRLIVHAVGKVMNIIVDEFIERFKEISK